MNSRYLAGTSLAIMAGGFATTLFLPESLATYVVQGGFEAGLVGGIADWFAVTALFRHPFGLPIPHTSLLLKNRDKIVQSLISAMENEMLNKQSIENKLRKLHLLQLGTSMLTRLMSRRRVRTGIVDLLKQALLKLPLEKAVPHLQAGIAAYIQKVDAKAAVDTVLTKAMNEGYDELALDYALNEAAKWAVTTETQMLLGRLANEQLSEVKLGGFMGMAVQAFAGFMDEAKLGGILQNLLVSGIQNLRGKDNPYRQAIVRELRVKLFELADDEAKWIGLKEWSVNRLHDESTQLFLLAQLQELRGMLLDKLDAERESGGKTVFAAYRAIVRSVSEEQEKVEEWENRLLAFAIHIVESNHYRIGELVRENLNRLDDASLVRMLEEKVGKDLQWIRVNGALCGFVIGIALSFVRLLG